MEGEPRLGTFAGECVDLPFAAWIPTLQRVRGDKRWQWFGAMSPDVAIGGAIVRTGYAGNVFCWVFDRQRAVFVEDLSRVLPRPAVDVVEAPTRDGRIARYRGLMEGFRIDRAGRSWSIEGSIGDVRLDLRIDETATPITAICPTTADIPHALNTTRKQASATATGRVRAGSHVFDLDEDAAFLDFSHGQLTGETIWQWAIGSGTTDDDRPVAFNLVASFNEGYENVVWLDGSPRFVGQASFELPDDLRDVWRVEADELSLTLQPEAVRTQELDLGVVASDYAQPLGVWTGVVAGRPFRGRGVAEHHRSVW